MAATPPVLRLAGISKRFGPLVANDGISLDLARGEVLALLGENGAGKSTLVSVLFGHYVADAGRIEVDGRPLPPGQPRAALAAGIGMVHQHFTLADNMSVLDNVMLGTESLLQPFSRRDAALGRLVDLGRRFGLAVDPLARVATLSVGERQRVEILKALYRGARVLILDEPTAVLTPPESASLFATLRQMVDAGLAVIFISHKLDEVLRVSHRIAVLRSGRLVAERPTAGADKAMLAEAMVGRSVRMPRRAAVAAQPGTPACELRSATVDGPGSRGRALLDAASLVVARGEIVAIAGVSGNGQAALAELLSGERAPDQGELLVAGRVLRARPRDFVDAGVARVPEDRHAVGLVGEMSLWENAMLESYHRHARWGIVARRAAVSRARSLVERYDVRGAEAGGVATPARRLSGGNMQKLILGRVLMAPTPGDGERDGHREGNRDGDPAWAPPLIVANQPTWGLDVGAVAYVHQRLIDAAQAGSGIVLISEDLDEVFAIADRVAVLHQGRLTPASPVREWSLAAIGLAMAGGASDAVVVADEDAR